MPSGSLPNLLHSSAMTKTSRSFKNKDLQQLFKEAESQGWEIRRAKRHIKLVAPDGGFVFTSGTPTDNRAVKNIRSTMRKKGFQG